MSFDTSILDVILEFFKTVFGWLYDFIINDFILNLFDFGCSAFNSIGSLVFSSVSNGSFLYFILGALIAFPLLKLAIKIIRG